MPNQAKMTAAKLAKTKAIKENVLKARTMLKGFKKSQATSNRREVTRARNYKPNLKPY